MNATATQPLSPTTTSAVGVNDVRVLIADDDRASSYRIWISLSGMTGAGAISTGESYDEVLSLARHDRPEVSMVSATFGGGEGLTLAHRLKRLALGPPVLVYDDDVDPRLAGAAIVAGADGVFASKTESNQLRELIGRVLGGEKVFPPLVPSPFEDLAAHVADGDRRIVAMLFEGAHPDTIAALCGLSAREFIRRRAATVRCLDAARARVR
jgi:DNA-binding NarL/FixJ family response regulator